MIPPNRVGPDNRITLRFREYAYTSDSDVIYMSAPTLGSPCKSKSGRRS